MEAYSQRDSASAQDDAYHASRKETVRADIARRLKRICSHLSDAEFSQLVELMTENKMKADRRTTL